MKRILRPLCMILAVLLLVIQPVYATENENSRASAFFTTSSVYLLKTSDTSFEAWFDVSSTRIMDELGASSITIEKSYDKVNWVPLKICTSTTSPHLICENTALHGACVSYTSASTGCYYRAKIVLYAKRGTSVGEMIEYTSTLEF